MKTYREWRPTAHDVPGLGLEDRQDWIVAPVILTPNIATPLDESNYAQQGEFLAESSVDFEQHKFAHWATPFEIMLVEPTDAARRAVATIEASLADGVALDEDDWTERAQTAADDLWRCYGNYRDRLAYIRRHRGDHEFHGFADLLSCIRGRYFAGDAIGFTHGG